MVDKQDDQDQALRVDKKGPTLEMIMTDNVRAEQKLCMHRACLLGAGLLVHLTVCWAAFSVGYLDISTSEFMTLFAIAAGGFLVFLALIYLEWNLSFDDPDLALAQMIWAISVVVATSYFVIEMKPVVVLAGLAMIVVGTNRLDQRELTFFALYGVFTYMLAVAYKGQHGQVAWIQEAVILIAFALILVFGPLLFRYEMSIIQGALLDRNEQLSAALDKIKEFAIKDDLTGSYNRRHLTEVMLHQKAMADRGDYDFTICYIDLDFFKRVNDLFGHSTGDLVLKNFCTIANMVVREVDCVARLGGEEFVLVFGGTKEGDALVVAERINMKLRQMEVSPLDKDYRITASMGITEYRRGEDYHSTMERADKALYDAKRDGRNRVTISSVASSTSTG